MEATQTTDVITSADQSTKFSFCSPKQPQPCIQYTPENKAALNTFLLYFGGREAMFDKDGTANIFTTLKGNTQFIYCKPGSWLRVLGQCQFTSLTDRGFHELYNLV